MKVLHKEFLYAILTTTLGILIMQLISRNFQFVNFSFASILFTIIMLFLGVRMSFDCKDIINETSQIYLVAVIFVYDIVNIMPVAFKLGRVFVRNIKL